MKRITRAVVITALLAVQPAVSSAMTAADQTGGDALPRIDRVVAFHYDVSASASDTCDGAPSRCTQAAGVRDNRAGKTDPAFPTPTPGPSD